MKARVTPLRYWKTEHDETSCEDALSSRPADGLFAVADGVGTTSFSDIWSRLLVESFTRQPLLGNDPFEVEWWLRQAQKTYGEAAPPWASLSPEFQAKAREGSQSTLVTLRISGSQGEAVSAVFLAAGDSCALWRRAGADPPAIGSFPLKAPEDFNQPPVCLPTRLFDRNFHRVLALGDADQPITFAAGDTVILATDAVSKWVLSSGGRRFPTPAEAFQHLVGRADHWPEFIDDCRKRNEMIDDDSTALIITFAGDDAPGGGADALGWTGQAAPAVADQRLQEVEKARHDHNLEQVAIAYGDGKALALARFSLDEAERDRARQVADAMVDLRSALQAALRPGANQAAVLEPVWRRHAEVLENESCAANLVKSVQSLLPPAENTNAEKKTEATYSFADVLAGDINRKDDSALARDVEQALQALCSQDPQASEAAAWARLMASLTTQEQRDYLDAWQKRRDALETLRRAIQTDDDAAIAAAIAGAYSDALEGSPRLSEAEKARLNLARARAPALDRFRRAIQADDDAGILDAYEAKTLDDCASIAQAERERLDVARQRQALWTRLNQQLAQGDDDALAEAFDAYIGLPAPGRSPESAVRDRLNRAQRRVEAYRAVKQAMAENREWAIANAYRTYLELLGGTAQMNAELRARGELAIQRVSPEFEFHNAVASDDDGVIITSYDPVLDGDQDITQADRDRLDLARRRVEALRRFLPAASGDAPHRPDKDLIGAYSSVLDGCPGVPPESRQRLERASRRQAILEAMAGAAAAQDDAAFAEAAVAFATSADQMMDGDYLRLNCPDEQRRSIAEALERLSRIWKFQAELVSPAGDPQAVIGQYAASSLAASRLVAPDIQERLRSALAAKQAAEQAAKAAPPPLPDRSSRRSVLIRALQRLFGRRDIPRG